VASRSRDVYVGRASPGAPHGRRRPCHRARARFHPARARSPVTSRLSLYFRLGRVSNLPTVWTNSLAGIVLARGADDPEVIAGAALSLSFFYVGGMFLNDAFDG